MYTLGTQKRFHNNGFEFSWNCIGYAAHGREDTEPVPEHRLSGWIIKLTFRNGTLLTATTDTVGNYTFADLPSGTYIVEIAVQLGFRKTAPILGAYVDELLTGENLTGRDFGSTQSDS